MTVSSTISIWLVLGLSKVREVGVVAVGYSVMLRSMSVVRVSRAPTIFYSVCLVSATHIWFLTIPLGLPSSSVEYAFQSPVMMSEMPIE